MCLEVFHRLCQGNILTSYIEIITAHFIVEDGSSVSSHGYLPESQLCFLSAESPVVDEKI